MLKLSRKVVEWLNSVQKISSIDIKTLVHFLKSQNMLRFFQYKNSQCSKRKT